MINFISLLGACCMTALSGSSGLQPRRVNGNYDTDNSSYQWTYRLKVDNNMDFYDWYNDIRSNPNVNNYYTIFSYVRSDKTFNTVYEKSLNTGKSIDAQIVDYALYDSAFYLGFIDHFQYIPYGNGQLGYSRVYLVGSSAPSIVISGSLDTGVGDNYSNCTYYQATLAYYNSALHVNRNSQSTSMDFYTYVNQTAYNATMYDKYLIMNGYSYYGILTGGYYHSSINLTWFNDHTFESWQTITLYEFLPDSLDDIYGTGYENGYTAGYQEASDNTAEQVNTAYQEGYNDGYAESLSQDSTALTIFTGIINVALLPVNIFLQILNFEVFGINIGALVTSLLTVAIIIIIIRIVTGKKND